MNATQARWDAVRRRDADADGRFVYAVATTGVYCRPTCPSRRAHRKNVVFFATPADAERAGFRACERCRPTGPSLQERRARIAAAACRRIRAAFSPPSLDELAGAAGLSRHHFLRVFRDVVGVTPGQYAAAARTERVRAELRRRRTITEAIHGSGFGSSSRFYERSPEVLGMTPREFRRGGRG